MLSALRTRAFTAARSTPALRSFTTSSPTLQHFRAVSAEQFEAHVIQAPKGKLVIVDFYAEWCGPCKHLTPLLEKIVPVNSEIDLVTVDVDAQPELAAQFGIRAMPTVLAFRTGDQVSGFKGAIPEGQLRKFLDDIPK